MLFRSRVAPTKSPSPVRSPNVTVNGRVYIFTNDPTNQRIVRNGRKRVFSTLPKSEREAIAREAAALAASDVAIIPLYHQKVTWAMKKTIKYTARTDERSLAQFFQPQ